MAAVMVRTEPFKCPNCGTLYQVVKTDAGPETVGRQIKCRLNYLIDIGEIRSSSMSSQRQRGPTMRWISPKTMLARDRAAFSF